MNKVHLSVVPCLPSLTKHQVYTNHWGLGVKIYNISPC